MVRCAVVLERPGGTDPGKARPIEDGGRGGDIVAENRLEVLGVDLARLELEDLVNNRRPVLRSPPERSATAATTRPHAAPAREGPASEFSPSGWVSIHADSHERSKDSARSGNMGNGTKRCRRSVNISPVSAGPSASRPTNLSSPW